MCIYPKQWLFCCCVNRWQFACNLCSSSVPCLVWRQASAESESLCLTKVQLSGYLFWVPWSYGQLKDFFLLKNNFADNFPVRNLLWYRNAVVVQGLFAVKGLSRKLILLFTVSYVAFGQRLRFFRKLEMCNIFWWRERRDVHFCLKGKLAASENLLCLCVVVLLLVWFSSQLSKTIS